MCVLLKLLYQTMYIRGIVLKLMRKINDLLYTIQASSAFSSRTVNHIFI